MKMGENMKLGNAVTTNVIEAIGEKLCQKKSV